MSAKHTLGEWACTKNDRFMPMDGWSAEHEDFIFSAAAPIKADGKVIAIVVHGTDEFEPVMAELKANARLISAAPRLLAALVDLDEAYCDAGPDMTKEKRDFGRKALIAARAAIARATGEPT